MVRLLPAPAIRTRLPRACDAVGGTPPVEQNQRVPALQSVVGSAHGGVGGPGPDYLVGGQRVPPIEIEDSVKVRLGHRRAWLGQGASAQQSAGENVSPNGGGWHEQAERDQLKDT